MHEIGLLRQLVRTVTDFAAENEVHDIREVVVDCGELSLVIPEYLEELYPVAAKGSILQDVDGQQDDVGLILFGKTGSRLPEFGFEGCRPDAGIVDDVQGRAGIGRLSAFRGRRGAFRSRRGAFRSGMKAGQKQRKKEDQGAEAFHHFHHHFLPPIRRSPA